MMLAVSRQAEYFVLHVEFCYLCYLLIELVDSMHQSNMILHRMWLWSHRLKNLWVKGYIMSVSSDFKIEKKNNNSSSSSLNVCVLVLEDYQKQITFTFDLIHVFDDERFLNSLFQFH